tara:strand:+ start:118 stop:312 length:195 start_codon:yes stop_codon:yes gene_type:complete
MIITKTSPFSGETNTMDIDVTQSQIDAWYGGELIQNAMPNLSEDEREFIKSGIPAHEWNETFGE